jgi:diaminobutyrate-2-oxoglutarate transaminase
MDPWWHDRTFADEVTRKGALLLHLLAAAGVSGYADAGLRGRGLLIGVPCRDAATAAAVVNAAFERGLLVERCGPNEDVVKLLPPLTVLDVELGAAAGILAEAFARACR